MTPTALTGTDIPNTRKVDPASIRCSGCRQPATLDDKGRCEFCRRSEPPASPTFWRRVLEMVRGKA